MYRLMAPTVAHSGIASLKSLALSMDVLSVLLPLLFLLILDWVMSKVNTERSGIQWSLTVDSNVVEDVYEFWPFLPK